MLPHNSMYIRLILQEFHDSLMGGHSNVLKTLRCIQFVSHCDKIRKRVQEYVAGCGICQTHKYSTLSSRFILTC